MPRLLRGIFRNARSEFGRSSSESERYSFIFDGNAQSLDHALTSSELERWVRGAQHPRGNADTPAAYDVEPDTALRSSDHDGTVLF